MNSFQINIVFDELVAALSMAIDAYSRHSLVHGQRCSLIAEKIASELFLMPQKMLFMRGSCMILVQWMPTVMLAIGYLIKKS